MNPSKPDGGRRARAKVAQAVPATGMEGATPRQAIVVVHGQGKPRPMGTLRDFVATLWTTDDTLELAMTSPSDLDGHPSWIVPDDRTGLLDLQRISCPPLANGPATDFFELYFADIVRTAPLRNFWRWLRGLLWVNPRAVVPELRFAWAVLWLLSLLAAGAFATVALSVGRLMHTDWIGVLLRSDNRVALGLLGVFLALLLAVRIFLRGRLAGGLASWPLILAAFGTLAYAFREHPVFWAAAVFGALVAIGDRYLLPYFGAAASYLGTEADTVGVRNRVRERGLALLRALHNDPRYERIVIVSHSLGSVLAYDLLHLLWWQVGPTVNNPPSPEAIAALDAVDDFAASHPEEKWSDKTVADYQARQSEAWEALRAIPARPDPSNAERELAPGWKLSDFVSLGSPLANAQFLLAEGEADFDQLKHDWMLPCSPPNTSTQYARMVYSAAGVEAAHHGSVFGAVRWTNVYDPFDPLLFLIGDPVAGPVSGRKRFGRGIADRAVRMRHGGWVPRLFTHNYYWTDTAPAAHRPAPQIRILREAVAIAGRNSG